MNEPHFDELALALGELAASATHHDHEESDEPRLCPVCGERMTFFKQFDIVMDVCEEHGVWLDQGELATLLERTYWYRRDNAQHQKRDRTQTMDHTRKKFLASLNRVAGAIG